MLDAAQLMTWIAVALAFAPSIAYFAVYVGLYCRGGECVAKSRCCFSELKERSPQLKRASLTVVIPIRNEPMEYVISRLEEISRWSAGSRVDVVVVSMDPYEYYLELRGIVEKYRSRGLNSYVIWRSTSEGYKSRSLNVALWFSNTKYYYVMDVDSRVDYGFIESALRILESDPRVVAVVGRWRGLNRDTRVARALSASIDFVMETVYGSRCARGLPTLPLGTGTVYRRDFLLELNGWDENRLLDDLEIGCRIISRGGDVVYLSDHSIGVEVPRKYSSLAIQQERWAYGALDTLATRLKHVVFSPRPALSKIDIIAYLLQYVPPAITLIGAAMLALVAILTGTDVLLSYWLVGAAWAALAALYSACFVRALLRNGYSLRESLVNLGRSAVIVSILSPVFLRALIRSALRLKLEFRRTPKGRHDSLLGELKFPRELLVGLSFLICSVYLLLEGATYTGGWVATYSLPYIYAITRWRGEVAH